MKRVCFLALIVTGLVLCTASPSPCQTSKRYPTTKRYHTATSPVSTQSNQPRPVPTAPPVNNYTYTYYYPVPISQSPPVWFQVFSTIVLLVFTGGLWWTSVRQWRTLKESTGLTEKAVKAAEESAKATELALHVNRPFVLVTGMRMDPPRLPNRKLLCCLAHHTEFRRWSC
jgi:hypothetical protein